MYNFNVAILYSHYSMLTDVHFCIHRGVDILSILTYVNDEVSREEANYRGKKAKQVPDQSFRLWKRLVFPVPNTPYL